jgi:hypothetical protein
LQLQRAGSIGIREAALAACAAVAFTLAGCGGGDDNNSSSSAPANTGSATTTTPASDSNDTTTTTAASTRSAAEGMWQQELSSFPPIIILDDGTMWFSYGAPNPNFSVYPDITDPNLTPYLPHGVGHGSVSVTGNSLTGSGGQIDFWFPDEYIASGGNISGAITAPNTLVFTLADVRTPSDPNPGGPRSSST